MEELQSNKSEQVSGKHGDHFVTLRISYQTKLQLKRLAERYDRPVADMIRAVLKVGIPMMNGMSKAEEVMVKEYVQLFRRLRQVKALKDI